MHVATALPLIPLSGRTTGWTSNSTSSVLPNVPVEPKNGMIRVYENRDRTYTRPFSAKTVFFYKDGDAYFSGVRVPVSKSKYRNMESLLDDLNKNIEMPFGVRRLTTPMGRTAIDDLNQLEHLGKYVATSFRHSRGINFSALERLRKARDTTVESLRSERTGGQSYWIPSSPSFNQKLRMSRTLGLNIVPSKQPMMVPKSKDGAVVKRGDEKTIYFVLNGKSRIYRYLLNPLRLPSMEQLLADVSTGLEIAIHRLYDSDHNRLTSVSDIVHLRMPKVIACPRSERPALRESVTLPAINPARYAPRNKAKDGEASSSNASSSFENGIEKPQRMATSIRRNTRKATGAPRKKYIKTLPSILPTPKRSSLPDEGDSGKANSISSRLTESPKLSDEIGSGGRLPELYKRGLHHDNGETETESGGIMDESDEELSEIVEEADKKAKMMREELGEPVRPVISPTDDEAERKARMMREEMRDKMLHHNHDDEAHDEDIVYPDSRPGSRREPLSRLSRNDTVESSSRPATQISRKLRNGRIIEIDENGSRRGSGWSQKEDNLPTRMGSRPQTNGRLPAINGGSTTGTAHSRHNESRPSTSYSEKEEVLPTQHGSRPGTQCSQKEEVLPSRNGISRPSSNCSQKEIHLPTSHGHRLDTACSQTEDRLPSHKGSRIGTACSQREEILPSRLESRQSRIGSAKSRRESVAVTRNELLSSQSQREEILPSDEDEPKLEKHPRKEMDPHHAATLIQATFRGYHTRKRIHLDLHSAKKELHEAMVVPEDGEIVTTGRPGTNGTEEPQDEVLIVEPGQTPEDSSEPKANYMISVMTGNRWAADTESDLYITIIGEEGESDRIQLLHENIAWLQNEEPHFRQHQLDTFDGHSKPLGILTKIVIGHERMGYGAGIFIDEVLITETFGDQRKQYLFSVHKWFDSGQVDGKIERTVFNTAFYFLDSAREEIESMGRWEFDLHIGEEELSGTTSDLLIYGYGEQGSSVTRVENDPLLLKPGKKFIIQVDFGAIGNLLKIRIELERNANKEEEQPNFFLDKVELFDLDNEEHIVVRINKWLDISPDTPRKRPQAFREVWVFRPGVQDMYLVNYDGKVTCADMSLLTDERLYGVLIGMFDSGVFPMSYNEAKNEYTFKVECAYLGHVDKLKIIGNFNKQGQAIMEGLSVVQDILDFHVPGVDVATQVLSPCAYIRESTHAPYRYKLNNSKVIELDDTKPYFKTLCLTDSGLEGMSTRKKKYEVPRGESSWVLDMAVQNDNYLAPQVFLIHGLKQYEMNLVEDEHKQENILQYEIRGVPEVLKIRVITGPGEDFFIQKIRLRNLLTLMEMRLNNFEHAIPANGTAEFGAVYPDIPPELNSLYTVQLRTISAKGKFVPCINMFAENTDSGVRPLGEPREMQKGVELHDLDAILVGELQSIEVTCEASQDFEWKFEIQVTMTARNRDYATDKGVVNTKTRKFTTPLFLIEQKMPLMMPQTNDSLKSGSA